MQAIRIQLSLSCYSYLHFRQDGVAECKRNGTCSVTAQRVHEFVLITVWLFISESKLRIARCQTKHLLLNKIYGGSPRANMTSKAFALSPSLIV